MNKTATIIALIFSWDCVAQNTVVVQPGTELKSTTGTIITLQNMNLVNNGMINMVTSEGVFRFSGNQNNTLSGINQPVFSNLEIAKTGNATLQLQRSINVNTSIVFTSGLIDLNGNNILLAPNALLLSESESSHITGNNGGYIEISQALSGPSSINAGNLGAIITSTSNMGMTTIRRGHLSQVNGNGNGNSILRYYDIIPTNNSSLNATLRFKYLDAEVNSLTENSLVLWKSNNNIDWSVQGMTTRDLTTNYVEKIGISDFSRWTLSTAGNALPVVWGLFNSQCTNNEVTLKWQTQLEWNTANFIIQGSNDGTSWNQIAIINAAGQSNNLLNYSYTVQGTSDELFRIVQTDIDGRQIYSPVLRSYCGQNEVFNVYPNPLIQNDINIAIASSNSISTIWFRIYDSRGSLIAQQQEKLQSGTNLINMKLPFMPAGNYTLIAMWDNGKTKSLKLLKK